MRNRVIGKHSANYKDIDVSIDTLAKLSCDNVQDVGISYCCPIVPYVPITVYADDPAHNGAGALIFNMGIPTLVRRHLYIGTSPMVFKISLVLGLNC